VAALVVFRYDICLRQRRRSGTAYPSEGQSDRMSEITNDGFTRSGTECFIAVPVWQWQQWASKG